MESARDGSLSRRTERRLKKKRKEEDMVLSRANPKYKEYNTVSIC